MQTLAYPVHLVQMDRKDRKTDNLERYTEYAILGWKELKTKVEPGVSVAYLIPNEALLAPMPPDFLFYTKVAIEICGVPYTLSRNDRIPLPKIVCATEIGQLISEQPDLQALGGQYFSYVPHFRAGQFVGEYYSLGAGNTAGYFRVDDTNKQFVFQNIPQLPITLEYVSSKHNGLNTLISDLAVPPLREYIHWELTERTYGKDKQSINDKQRARDNFLIAFRSYKKIIQTPTIDEFLDMSLAGFKSGAKLL